MNVTKIDYNSVYLSRYAHVYLVRLENQCQPNETRCCQISRAYKIARRQVDFLQICLPTIYSHNNRETLALEAINRVTMDLKNEF